MHAGVIRMAQLASGDQVSIIGGGPAGSIAALALLDAARSHQIKLRVTIFEPRDFKLPGPGGCNHCAGMLSHRVVGGLERLGLAIPAEVIQAEISSYAVHLHGETRHVRDSELKRTIPAVYRGAGPRDRLANRTLASFDDFLLKAAIERGAQRIPHRAIKVTWEDRPLIHAAGEKHPADLVVLACGVNSRAPLDPTFGYRPPRTAVMAQDEIPRPLAWPKDQIDAFFRQPPGLIFGALIPKGDYLNISLLGKGLPTDAVSEFVAARGQEAGLDRAPRSLCGCTPRVAVRPASRYYGDRWVAVGDAAATRLYKDGIGSALTTSRSAMAAAVDHGISTGAFRRYYAPTFRAVARDNFFGRMLFRMWSMTLESQRLSIAWLRTLDWEAQLPYQDRRMHRILWGMMTGDDAYESLFWQAVHPTMLMTTLRSLAARG
jgi:flavin-dependent dehydrogenase